MMKVPLGKISKTLKIEGGIGLKALEEALGKNLCGYIRITTDEGGIKDYYLFVHNSKVVGAHAELPGDEELNGKEAYDRSMDISTGIMDIRTLHEETLKTFISSNKCLEVNIAPANNSVAPVTEKSSPVGFIRIAGVRVPILASKKAFNVKGTNLRALIDTLNSESLTGCLRITADTPVGVQDGFVLFDGGKRVIAVFEGETTYSGPAAFERISSLSTFEGIANIYKISSSDLSQAVSHLGRATLAAESPNPADHPNSPPDRQSLLKKYKIKEPDGKSIDDMLSNLR